MPNSNTQMIQKGKISSIEGEPDRNGDKTTARVLPSTADSLVTRPLTIPWYLRGDMGNLSPGVEVAYAMFEDGTGLILSRMDGEWPGIVPGDITIKKGALTVQDKGVSVPSADVTASGISLNSHTPPHRTERQPARTKKGGRASCPSWHRGTERHGASPPSGSPP